MQQTKTIKYSVSILLVVMALALIFSGCQPKNANQSSQSTDQKSQETTTATSNSYQVTNKEVTQTMQAEPMKQLADFKEIAATQATITTDKGDIVIELFREETPITTANFVELAESGFYDGIRFHRIIEDFMAQVGDPLSKDDSKKALWGTGGAGYVIPDEFVSSLKHDAPGIVSMANRGPNTGGSQFFITYEPTPWLDGKHTVFGRVTSGMDVLAKLEIGDAIQSITLK